MTKSWPVTGPVTGFTLVPFITEGKRLSQMSDNRTALSGVVGDRIMAGAEDCRLPSLHYER
jgi:hypothetical protein